MNANQFLINLCRQEITKLQGIIRDFPREAMTFQAHINSYNRIIAKAERQQAADDALREACPVAG